MTCPFSKQQDEFTYENILRKNRGLLDIKIKVSIRDKECLSLVYTPGVATPCLEIQKDLSNAYAYTNKGNSIMILTDSSCICGKGECKNWNNNAAMPYLEAFSVYYKTIANIDAYPIILDCSLIKDAETWNDTVNAISPCYQGVELFMICPERMKKFNELYEKSAFKGQYAYVDASNKKEIDAMLATKKTYLNSHAIFAAIWRVALDSKCARNLNEIVDDVIAAIKSDKLNLNQGLGYYTDFDTVFTYVVNLVFDKKYENKALEKHNWNRLPMTKDYVHKKFQAFLTFGTSAWVEDMPEGYFMKFHTVPENSNLLHWRNRGVIQIGLNVNIPAIGLKTLWSWENIEKISKIIVAKPEEVFNLTCKSNYGGIVTNGTAILGLGNIGALAGMPVMEGKSVLFKYFGGTNIAPICIQEMDNDKVIAYTQRIAPSFCIINLEDIKGPDCFNIETKLIETVDCPVFHDDQHGTACVVLAGLINAIKLRGSKKEDVKIVMNGAGASGISVCQLLIRYGFKKFVVCDTAGAIYKGRPKNMNPFKSVIADLTNQDLEKGTLAEVWKGADVVIGLSGPNTISMDNVKSMNPKPIVFALANPTPEIFPKDAFAAGAFIVATGRSDFPNQINNSVVFPGIFRGVVDSRAPKITLEMKIASAEAIANLVPDDLLRTDFIMPSALNIETSVNVAVNVAKTAIEKGQTAKKNINLDKLQENIHSYFIDQRLFSVDN